MGERKPAPPHDRRAEAAEVRRLARERAIAAGSPTAPALAANGAQQAAPAKTDARKPEDDPVGKVYDSELIRRLGHYLKPYWWQSAISAVSVTLKSLE